MKRDGRSVEPTGYCSHNDRAPLWIRMATSLMCVSIGIAGCGTEVQPPIEYELENVQNYGLQDVRGAPRGQTQPAGGAVLGRIEAVVEGPNTELYVLDADYKKIAVFDRNGDLKQVILGGYGEGPREFTTPIAMDIYGDTALFVYDYHLGRVTEFTSTGGYIGSLSVPRHAKDLLVTDSTIWFTTMPAHEDEYMLFGKDRSGPGMKQALKVSRSDLRATTRGVVGLVGQTFEGDLVAAHERPTLWFVESNSGTFVRKGREVLPESTPLDMGEGLPTKKPGYSSGIVGLNEGRVAIVYMLRDVKQSPFLPKGFFFDVYSRSGDLVGRGSFNEEWISEVGASRDGQHIYVATPDPYPHVVKYRVVANQNLGGDRR